MTARAQWERKGAYINSEFGLAYAKKVFNLTDEELDKLVGRYSRGKRKGQLRGYLSWYKTTSGGWVKTGRYDFDAQQGCGFIAKRGLTFGHSIEVNGQVVAGLDEEKEANRMGRRGDPVLEALKARCGQRRPAQEPSPAPEPEADIYADLWEDMTDEALCQRYARQVKRITETAGVIASEVVTPEEKEAAHDRLEKATKVITSMLKAIVARNLSAAANKAATEMTDDQDQA